jgi:hypothetical protein
MTDAYMLFLLSFVMHILSFYLPFTPLEKLQGVLTKLPLESYCDSLIREQDKLLQFGVISVVGTSNKAFVSQQKDKYKYPKKKHSSNNMQNKGPKPS